jgi:uncharacterized protein (DUF58 family)
MPVVAENYKKYLDPAVLARIGGLDLRARLLVEGFIAGMHRSPAHGLSIEFAEHRKYSQGDDLRFLDWKVYGRTDKHYIKEYEQESNLRLLLVVDTSESMGYQSVGSPWSKREYAITVAAGLSYLAVQQGDAAGAITFDTALHRHGRASNQPGEWKHIVSELQQTPAAGKTKFRAVLDELAESLREKHLIVLMSDMLGPVQDILTGVKHLRHRRHEPVLLQILDHAELTFPFSQPMRLVGLEGVGPVLTEPLAIRDRYLELMQGHIEQLRLGCHHEQTDFQLLDTSEALNTALAAYLSTRMSRLRKTH